jgi:hypothetical protein
MPFRIFLRRELGVIDRHLLQEQKLREQPVSGARWRRRRWGDNDEVG